MLQKIREDIQSIRERDPAARGTIEILMTYSGLHAVWMYRIAHMFYKKNQISL